MRYEDILLELEDIFKKRKFRLGVIESISLPSEKFIVFNKETVGKGYNLSWWGIPVIENNKNEIYFLTRGN